jgi:hypothetical protein
MSRSDIQFACQFLLVILLITPCFGDEPNVELSVSNRKYQGKVVSHDEKHCMLMEPEGDYVVLSLDEVKNFRKLNSSFQPASVLQMKNKLQKEFGTAYQVKSNRNFVIVAHPTHAEKYTAICEDVYASFLNYFSVRGFKLATPEFPLVVIVFNHHQPFLTYAKEDGVKAVEGLAGYYLPSSNRVALYENNLNQTNTGGLKVSEQTPVGSGLFQPESAVAQQSLTSYLNQPLGRMSAPQSITDTITHEATHQIAYNTELHSRYGENPRWVVEGLAMTFEAPGNRSNSKGNTMSRINTERYMWFKNFVQSRRLENSLAKFISDDKSFSSKDVLDHYSEAWALTFFLIETRGPAFAKYLRLQTARPRFTEYTAEERIKDFKLAFGDNLNLLESHYLRYYQQLK